MRGKELITRKSKCPFSYGGTDLLKIGLLRWGFQYISLWVRHCIEGALEAARWTGKYVPLLAQNTQYLKSFLLFKSCYMSLVIGALIGCSLTVIKCLVAILLTPVSSNFVLCISVPLSPFSTLRLSFPHDFYQLSTVQEMLMRKYTK